MMSVVVHYQHAIPLAFDLKSTLGALKFAKRQGDVVELDSEIKSHGNRRQRVLNVVQPRHSKSDFTHHFAEGANNEPRAEIRIKFDSPRRHVSLRRGTVADRSARQRRYDCLHVLIVQTQNNCSVERDAVRKTHEALLDLLDAPGEVIEMIRINVCQNRDGRSQQQQRSIRFIRFHDDVFAKTVPGIRTKRSYPSAY